MKEILEALAAAQSWVFEYGRRDFQNLINVEEQTEVVYLFLDPVVRTKRRNDTGGVEKIVYSGAMMLLYSSDIDEVDYDYRYENYIKKIVDTKVEIVENDLICGQSATIENWKEQEVINLFDYNLDGVIIDYVVSIDV